MPRAQPCRLTFLVSCVLLAQLGVPRGAAGQGGFEAIGTRAQGMGGAFVAVADDATATYWNPAGLAGIPILDASLAFDHLKQSDTGRPAAGDGAVSWKTRGSGFAVALPVLGVSYYRLRTLRARPVAIVPGDVVREDANTGFVGEAASTWNLGVTLVQSVGDNLVAGTTLRLVRAGAAGSTLAVSDAGGALDEAGDLNARGETKFDADFGVMAYLGRARVGVTIRNLVAPTWDAGSLPLESDRLLRVGVAWGPDPVRGRRSWSIASDADLATAEGPDGDRRSIAVGAEHWFRNGRVGIRGGARAQTVGDARPVATGGASVGIRSGLLLEGQVTAGSDTIERGWGLGARVTF